ncbi:MAG: M48 family metallopeptidase [Candidatus Ornithomonoglobus sp.]
MLRKTGNIEYELTFKRIRNINLRVSPDNRIKVSAPYGAEVGFIDDFVQSRREFIAAAMDRNAMKIPVGEVMVTDAEIYRKLYEIHREVYKLFFKYNFRLPSLKIRDMKSQWGNCRRAQSLITLNKRLYMLPRRQIELVAAHELSHMVQPNHSAAFYAVLNGVMPDWRERDAELKNYKLV